MYITSGFIKEIKESLSRIINESGTIVYSSVNSICKGDLYIMGLNPGGGTGDTVGQTLDHLPEKSTNSYRDERWNPFEIGKHPLQKNYAFLMQHLNTGGEEVFSTNLIFTRSRSADGANYPISAEKCWHAHKLFIKIVDPMCFLVFGNSSISPYDFIKNKYQLKECGDTDSGHGNWKIKSSRGIIEGKERLLIGLPHLSRYHICYQPEAMKWITDKIDTFNLI